MLQTHHATYPTCLCLIGFSTDISRKEALIADPAPPLLPVTPFWLKGTSIFRVARNETDAILTASANPVDPTDYIPGPATSPILHHHLLDPGLFPSLDTSVRAGSPSLCPCPTRGYSSRGHQGEPLRCRWGFPAHGRKAKWSLVPPGPPAALPTLL